jgi:N-acyl-L-homoserine lactone synthetase
MLLALLLPSETCAMSLLAQLLTQSATAEFAVSDYLFVETKDPSTIAQILRQRHEVYVFEGYIEPDAFPCGLFSDAFDEVSAHIAAFDRYGSVVGSSRVVPPSILGLPTHRLFRLPELGIASALVGEVGRLAISPAHRGQALAVANGLIAGIYRALRARGLSHFLAFMHPALVRLLQRLHIPVQPIGELELGPEQKQARQLMTGYFDRGRVRPTLCSLDEMDRSLGI